MQAEFEFLVMRGGESQSLLFPSSPFVIGSAPECGLRFPASMVELRHAEISVTATNKVFIKDLTGQGLTFVNGMAVTSAEVRPGALVRLGEAELLLKPPRTSSGTQSVATATATVTGEPFKSPGSSAGIDATARRSTPFRESAVELKNPTERNPTPPPPVSSSRVSTLGRQLTPGTVIGDRYEITARIAAGGMGEVYKAKHVELGKAIAVKVMRPELSEDPEFVARFKREAISTGGIGQINIVDISDFGRTDDGRFYFVMEFLDGVTLTKVIQSEGAMPVERVLNIAVQVARALAAAHSLGVVHRDLKPENIMLLQKQNQRDFVKVVDFGVAKLPNPDGTKGFTMLGMVVGTPQYMSPEQARAVAVDHRSDIYSLGLILYELLTGKPTFEGETPTSLMVKQVSDPPPPLVIELAPLAELIMQMLEKHADARPQTMEEVLARLEELLAERRRTPAPGAATPVPRSSGSRPVMATPSSTRKPTVPEGRAATSSSRITVPAREANTEVEVEAATTPGTVPAEPVVAPKRVRTRPEVEVAGTDTSALPDEAEPQLPTRSRGPLVVLLALVVIAVAGAGYLATREPEAPKGPVTPVTPTVTPPVEPHADPGIVPPPVAEVVMVSLHFVSDPTGAEVYEGDVLQGVTPLTLKRAQGSVVELRAVHEGSVELTRKVRFNEDETIQLTLAKQPTSRPAHPKQPGEPKGPKEKPGLIETDPYADPKEPVKKPELKEGVY